VSEPQETVIACLTPAGAGAIATLAVHGPDAWRLCRELFSPFRGELPEEPETVEPNRFFLGRLGEEMQDEAILSLRRAAPVPSVELHCHGGREVLAVLVEAFRRRGAREIGWSEWQRRAIASPVRAAAAVALAHAPTPRTAAILLDQFHGAFERAIDLVRADLEKGDLDRARIGLEGLLHNASLGLHLTHPWRVAAVGAPNVGKSSLVNALAGFRRCVVSETPGTTRDVVTTLLALDGWPVELADTAGLREAGESLEEAGMRLARETAAKSDLCLWVVDASTEAAWPEGLGGQVLLVVNKTDLPAAWDLAQKPEALRVSARTGEGLPELCAEIARRLVPQASDEGAAVPFTREWCDSLEVARRACLAGNSSEARQALDRVVNG
jgi:tRNA modification GTPase